MRRNWVMIVRAVLVEPVPDARLEGLAAELLARRSLRGEVLLDRVLRRDAGVVVAGLEERVEALHPLQAHDRVGERELERMAHVELARDVRRRVRDDEALARGVGLGGIEALVLPRPCQRSSTPSGRYRVSMRRSYASVESERSREPGRRRPPRAGREAAAARRAYREAYEHLKQAEPRLEADDLEHLAEAAYWTGKLDEAIAFRERAHAAYLEAGDKLRAAMVAIWLSRATTSGRRRSRVSSGWFAKAERLLEGEEESPAHGYLAFAQAMNLMMTGELDASIAKADAALDVRQTVRRPQPGRDGARRQGSRARPSGRGDRGPRAPRRGDARPRRAASSSRFPTGLIYCVTITSCHGVGDYRRAAEWTDAANRWCDRQDVTGLPRRLPRPPRERRAASAATGPTPRSRRCRRARSSRATTPGRPSAGFYEIGEIRRRRGDFAAAEEAYRQGEGVGPRPAARPCAPAARPGQGRSGRRPRSSGRWPGLRTRSAGSAGSRPRSRSRSPAGDFKTARAAAEELESLVDKFKRRRRASAGVRGDRVSRLGPDPTRRERLRGRGDRARARGRDLAGGRRSRTRSREAQMLLGLALRRLGDEDGARDELTAPRRRPSSASAPRSTPQRAAELLGERALDRTFMFTDIVDSTKLVEALGEEKWRKLLTWHDKTLRELIEAEGGEVIKQTGDGYFAAFQSARRGARRGGRHPAGARRARAARPRRPNRPPHGRRVPPADDDDYAGQGVHMAARIGALAGGGRDPRRAARASTAPLASACPSRGPRPSRASTSRSRSSQSTGASGPSPLASPRELASPTRWRRPPGARTPSAGSRLRQKVPPHLVPRSPPGTARASMFFDRFPRFYATSHTSPRRGG